MFIESAVFGDKKQPGTVENTSSTAQSGGGSFKDRTL